MKSRHKITLFFTLIVTAILLVVSFTVYYFASLERQKIFKKRLKNRADNNAQIFSYFADSSASVLNRINNSSRELLPDKTVAIYDRSGKPYYEFRSRSADSLWITKEVIEETLLNGEYFYHYGIREALAIYYAEEKNGVIVVVAAHDMDGWTQLRQLEQIFIVTLLIGTAISLAAGHLFSKQLLKPVAQIITEVNDISSHNLSHRINAGDTQDELNQLANTFNQLLDRLQESFTSQRRFISNASHELSTPLTSISSQLQVTLQRDRTKDEYRQVMQSVQEDVVQMRQLTKSLLEIAKTGSQGSIELDEIRIDEILFKIMADMKKINSSYEVELTFSDFPGGDPDFLVFGNSDLLYIALKNIVENGCKFSPDHTSRVNLRFNPTSTFIDVSNKGTTINKEEMEQIFQPFYRSVNSEGTSGFGLGLALAKRIVAIHKGTLEIISAEESEITFTVALPKMIKKQ